MKIIDLSHALENNLPVYPGDQPIILKQLSSTEKDGYNNYQLTLSMHSGTHIDGPMHLTESKTHISDLPLESFTGRGKLINVRGLKEIELNASIKADIESGDILLFYSGYDEKIHEKEYFSDYPVFTGETIQWIVDKRVKFIGIDWSSPDYLPYPSHKILLSNNILILENLTNLGLLLDVDQFEVFAFPLKIKADSSIVRAVARIS